jgi:hypothetical protein
MDSKIVPRLGTANIPANENMIINDMGMGTDQAQDIISVISRIVPPPWKVKSPADHTMYVDSISTNIGER